MLTQNNDKGKENALYYITRTIVGVEVNYSSMEKIYLTLVFTIQKLQHYLFSYQIILFSTVDPLKYILSKPVLSERLVKCTMLLAPFDIKFMPQKAVKGQAIADFLGTHPCSDNEELPYDKQIMKLCLLKLKHSSYILTGQQGDEELE